MRTTVTQQFFADFCEANPVTAHCLMMAMLQRPTGGHTIVLPQLIESEDQAKYWRETEAIAKKFILKPRKAA